MTTFLYLLVFATIALIAMRLSNYNTIVHSQWNHAFDNIQFSSESFYQSVQEAAMKRGIPQATFSRTSLVMKLRTLAFDERREYLCIDRGEYRFLICAAPFGTGFFVSWWFVEREPGYISLIKRIPIARKLLELKTFYQLDSETMYRTFVHYSVLDGIEKLTAATGVRALTEYERRIRKD